ncbi:AfsA-related hotdog domain-containing protein [Streptomyces acidicola]|uniref:AfsA-related hotdog domain-containing protein n=1 Tax=Streptomyces acidicola TaxID=2596892 RepID=UPI00378E93C1
MDTALTSQPTASAQRPTGLTAPLHLLHRPNTPEGFLLDATAPVEQHFALSAELPSRHGTFNDGPDTFHDLLFVAETLCQATHFVAHQYFRIPPEHPAVFVSSGLDILDLAPWRRTGHPAHITLDITLTPVDVVGGVPRGLDCRSGVAIDGVNCGSASARVQFLTPQVYRPHREHGRQESLLSAIPAPRRPLSPASLSGSAKTEQRAVRPELVGRGSPRNVLVGPPLRVTHGEFVLPVTPDPAHEIFGAGPEDHVPGPVFLEASRQASLLVAAEQHGLRPAHAVTTRLRASFRGFGDADLPLTCTVTSQDPVRDDTGRPTVSTRLAFSQGSRILCTASTVLLQDC